MKHKRIITQNFYAPGRGYFGRVVYPSLLATKNLAVPTVAKYIIAGKHIHIYLYGKNTSKIFPLAFSHQKKSNSSNPDLIIHAWDSTITKIDPIPPWDDIDYQKPSEQADKTFFGAYVGGEESLSFYDTEIKTGFFWMHDASELSDWSTGAPFRAILHWFFNTQNIHLIHGAVVGKNNKSILITAKSGSGKSTTALSAALSNMDYIGDDYVAVASDQNIITAHSLYNSAKVTRSGLELFPELKSAVWNKNYSGNQKAVVFMSDLANNQVQTSSTLKAIFIPRILPGVTEIIPTNKINALVAIAPTTLLQLPCAEMSKITILKELIERIPCYYLNLGPEIAKIPPVIEKFLDSYEK